MSNYSGGMPTISANSDKRWAWVAFKCVELILRYIKGIENSYLACSYNHHRREISRFVQFTIGILDSFETQYMVLMVHSVQWMSKKYFHHFPSLPPARCIPATSFALAFEPKTSRWPHASNPQPTASDTTNLGHSNGLRHQAAVSEFRLNNVEQMSDKLTKSHGDVYCISWCILM